MCAGTWNENFHTTPTLPFTYATNNLPKRKETCFQSGTDVLQLTKHGGSKGRQKNSHVVWSDSQPTRHRALCTAIRWWCSAATLMNDSNPDFWSNSLGVYSILEKTGILGFWTRQRLVLKWATRPITITLWLYSQASNVSSASGAALVELMTRERYNELLAATIFLDTLSISLQDVKKTKQNKTERPSITTLLLL